MVDYLTKENAPVQQYAWTHPDQRQQQRVTK